MKRYKQEGEEGKNWLVLGDKNTGKSFISLLLAVNLYNQGKRLIIADSRQNLATYGEFFGLKPKIYDVDKFIAKYRTLDETSISLVTFTPYNFDEFALFLSSDVKNSAIVLDDLGTLYKGNPPSDRYGIVMTPKNNSNDIFYQIHTLKNVGPAVLDMMDVYVLKQMSGENIPDKVPDKKHIEILCQEIIEENRKNPPKQKWAWRILDRTTGEVIKQNANGKIVKIDTVEYFG